jgi:hypothetical protein
MPTTIKLKNKLVYLRQLWLDNKDPKSRQLIEIRAQLIKNAIAANKIKLAPVYDDPFVRRVVKELF